MKWTQCCQEARRQLAFDQFVPIGGDTENGKKLLALIRKLHADTAKTNRIVIPRKKPTAKCPWRPPRPRDNLIDVRHYVDYGKGNVPVSEEPSYYPGVTFKNGNTFKQIRANKEARDLDSWCVNWGRRDADGKAVRETRHFYVGQFYTKEDRDYNRAKERARQFAIEFRKEKVREMDQATLLRDRINYEQLSAQAKLQDYRPPKNRVAARQSGVQGRTRERKTRDYEGVTWMCTTQDWQAQMRKWDACLRKSVIIKQCHIKVQIPHGTEPDDTVAIEKAVEEARLKAVAIRKEWERRFRTYTVKHYAKFPKYDETGKLADADDDELGVPGGNLAGTTLDQYGNPIPVDDEGNPVPGFSMDDIPGTVPAPPPRPNPYIEKKKKYTADAAFSMSEALSEEQAAAAKQAAEALAKMPGAKKRKAGAVGGMKAGAMKSPRSPRAGVGGSKLPSGLDLGGKELLEDDEDEDEGRKKKKMKKGKK